MHFSPPPYKNKAFSLGASFLAVATVFGSVNVANAVTITPEPTSVMTLIGVGVLGIASKLQKKA